MDYTQRIIQLAKLIRSAKRVVAFTGAGISTESGIPDFRSKGTGLWEKVDPVAVLSVKALKRNPQRFYQDGFVHFLNLESIKPNSGHKVLGWLEQKKLLASVITQNIDGLHQKAGSQRVLEVHGHLRTGHCMRCQKKYKMFDIRKLIESGTIPPMCSCGGVLRPDVTLFGDPMPRDFWSAISEVEQSDLLLVVGSSLTVSPANSLANIAKRVAIINLEITSFDHQAELVIREKAGKVLSDLRSEIERQ
ncbi:MAG: NAD-dependent deacylase [Syntrophomonadaceae bacterium]|nr:NAD-dependent deacylase [Syntrophomonadaceae bacterium]